MPERCVAANNQVRRHGRSSRHLHRVHLHDENGVLFSLPATWTDVAPSDPFVVIAEGRCPFTTAGLLGLADLIDRLPSQPGSDEAVNPITP